jgi:hypothetical protein
VIPAEVTRIVEGQATPLLLGEAQGSPCDEVLEHFGVVDDVIDAPELSEFLPE